MSSYKNFGRCVVCRSYENLKMYEKLGCEYEVTMLLNTLYLAVMYPIEHRSTLHVKAKKAARIIREYANIDECGNQFNDDDLVRYLRNGLAHFNIKVADDNFHGAIAEIMIWANNMKPTVKCPTPCENPKCIPPQINEKDGGKICIFKFSVESLRTFTEKMVNFVLETIPPKECTEHNCKLLKE